MPTVYSNKCHYAKKATNSGISKEARPKRWRAASPRVLLPGLDVEMYTTPRVPGATAQTRNMYACQPGTILSNCHLPVESYV